MDRVHGVARDGRVAELRPVPLGEEFEGGEGGGVVAARLVPRVDTLRVAVVLPEPDAAERALQLRRRRRASDGEEIVGNHLLRRHCHLLDDFSNLDRVGTWREKRWSFSRGR